ncbi:1684_t:CDS:2, partial [Acaulospora colombiana]
SSTSSLTEASEVFSSLSDTESETQEPPSPPETPGHPRKRRLSQSESSGETEDDTDITTEPQSPPDTPIPQNPCKICGGFEPMDTQYPLVIVMEYLAESRWEEVGVAIHVSMDV